MEWSFKVYVCQSLGLSVENFDNLWHQNFVKKLKGMKCTYYSSDKLENSPRTEWECQSLPKDYSVHYSTVAVIQLQSSKGSMEEKGGINNFTGKVFKQFFSKNNQVWLWVYVMMLLFSLVDIHSATPFEDLNVKS